MTPFARQDENANDESGQPRRFRLVEHSTSPADEPETGSTPSSILGMISSRLLVDLDTWKASTAGTGPERVIMRAEVPLVSSLARIRSDADAALALTGVLELLARRFHIGLPCADAEGEGFLFDVPEGANSQSIAEAIDGMLLGTVRSSDLQGQLKARARARVDLADPADDPRS